MPLPFTVRRTDPDAAAFCARSGASDRAAVSAFVRGVKDLGLWESMVCWPLRSEQNAGTGTTAYSLGGLGTFNGTLTNGPTWGADGVNFNALTAQIVATGTIAQPLAIMGAVDLKTATNGGALIDGTSRVTIFSGSLNNRIQFFAGSTLDSGASNTFATGNNFVGAYANGANSVVYTNGIGTNGNAGANSLGANTIVIGNNTVFGGSFGAQNINIAFCAIFSGQVYNDAVRSLYKSTLGTGLGLP